MLTRRSIYVTELAKVTFGTHAFNVGGRWERLETTSSSSTQVVQTTESNYPTYLPPPRSRPDLPTQKVTVINEAQSMSAGEQLPLTNHLKARGRTSDRLTGLNPMQRSKTPVVTHGSLEGRAREMFELASDSENPIYEDVPMEFTEEEGDRTAECRGPGRDGDGCDGHRNTTL